jgi:hypothetical protein
MRRRVVAVAASLLMVGTIAGPAHADFRHVIPLINFEVPKLNRFWGKVVFGSRYHKPRGRRPVRLYVSRYFGGTRRQNWQTACGNNTINNPINAGYCPVDEKIYVDLPFAKRMLRNCKGSYAIAKGLPKCYDHDHKPRTTGDGAFAYVLAHEWAHHVQTVLRWPLRHRKHGQFAQYELHADCFAGLFVRWLALKRIFTQEDYRETFYAISHLGDARGTKPWNPNAHGSGKLRLAWFKAGFWKYSIPKCNSVFRVPHPSLENVTYPARAAVARTAELERVRH